MSSGIFSPSFWLGSAREGLNQNNLKTDAVSRQYMDNSALWSHNFAVVSSSKGEKECFSVFDTTLVNIS